MTAVLTNAILGYASYHPRAPAQNSDWDLLYVAAALVGILLVVVLAATMMNRRDDRAGHH